MSEKNIYYLNKNFFSKLANRKYQFVMCLANFVGDLRNTCFMNSVLQALVNIPELTLYFLSKQYDKDKKINDGMADAYRDLLLNIHDKNARYENLVKINSAFAKVCKGYKIGSQYDANSFLSYFLKYVSKEANNPKLNKDELKILGEKYSKESNLDKKLEIRKQISESEINLFLLRLLHFYKSDEFYCSECNNCIDNSVMKGNILSGDFASLDDMIKVLSQDKLVNEGKDKAFCKTCNKEVSFYSRYRIYRSPNYLFVRREKNGDHDKFAFTANDFSIGELAAKKEDQDTKYELTSVICKSGDKNSGHCYACCYKFDNAWYYFSDNTLKKMPDGYKIDQDEEIKKNFFLGIYRKKDMRDKYLFEGYDINDFVNKNDEEDLKIISELNKNTIKDKPEAQKENNKENNIDTENERTEDDLNKNDNGSIRDKKNEIKKTEQQEYNFVEVQPQEKSKTIIDNIKDDKSLEKKQKLDVIKSLDIMRGEDLNELECNLDYLLRMSKTIDELEINFIKVKDKKMVFDESVKHLNKVFGNNKSNEDIFKELGVTKENIDNSLDKIKKELVIFIMCSNIEQGLKSIYIKLVKKANEISFWRRIWQTIKNIIMGKGISKTKQDIVFERISDIRKNLSTENQR